MRLTEFWARMRHQFGATYADSLARDHVFAGLGSRSVVEALEAGVDAKAVWQVVCTELDVPVKDRH